MTKLIFLGCLSRSRYEATCENAIKLIKSLDEEFQIIDNPPCCGALAYHITKDEDLREHVRFVNEWFKVHEVSKIVTICAGCYNYLTRYYKEFIPDFNIQIQHIMQFIAQPENLKKLYLKFDGKKLVVVYHDPCHLKNAINPILEEPRTVLNNIENIELKELENKGELSVCCGAGGGVFSLFKENSDYNSVLIFNQAKKQRAKALITACPFCYTALKRVQGIEENKIRIPVIKFEDFISKLIDGVDPLA
jgi:Fe-S oxidoreductase